MSPRHESVSNSLTRLQNWVFQRTEQLTSGKFWMLKVFLACVGFSILFSGGIDFGLAERGGFPVSYFQKAEHPLLDVTKIYPVNSHDANINFRLTVPVLMHVLGIHNHAALPIVMVLAICGTLIISCLTAFQLTRDRVCACFIALNVAATYVGSFGFIWYFDAFAIFLLALATVPSLPWWLRAIVVFAASFTDERAFVASGFLLVSAFFLPISNDGWLAKLRKPNFLGVMAALVMYLAIRMYLGRLAGLHSPTGGTGPGAFVHHLQDLGHAAVWFALEGGWLLYGLAILALLANKEYISATVFLLITLGFLSFGLMIGDVLRSTVYIFPLVLISLAILSQYETSVKLRSYCLVAFLISAVGGNYNVYLEKITWFQPLAIHGLELLAQAAYSAIYSLLPHSMPAGS